MGFFEVLIISIAGNAALTGILGYFGKLLFDKLVAKDMKRFEFDLQTQVNSALEHLRKELRIEADQHQVRFSRLHERRLEVIAELHALLVEVIHTTQSYASPVEFANELSKGEKHNLSWNALVDFNVYFQKKRIYIPEDICEKLEKFTDATKGVIIELGVYNRQDEVTLPDFAAKQKYLRLQENWVKASSELPLLRSEIEKEFRMLVSAS